MDPADRHGTPLDIGEFLVVARQVLLIPRVLPDPPEVVDAPEDGLTKDVKVGEVVHLVIEQPVHHRPGLGRVVDLDQQNDELLVNVSV